MSQPQPDSANARLAAEATSLLQELVRFNTVNPPGEEEVAQRSIAARLEAAGFTVELLEAVPGRPNLIAELRPAGVADGAPVEGQIVTLLSHVDTVLADAASWQRDPWSGDIDDDGVLWGRGAIDMKSQTAAEVAAACSLAEAGWRPATGLLRVVVAVDEEVGGTLGARWLCEHHPERIRTDILINEGGGATLHLGEQRFYSVGVGEKGVCRFVVRTRGRAAHASTPGVGVNALLKMIPVLTRLQETELPIDLTDAPRALLEGLGLLTEGTTPEEAVAALRERAPELAPLVEPMLRVTAEPTMVSASSKINVIPAKAEVRVDCRIPPGMDETAAHARIEALLDGLDVEIEYTETIIGNGSPLHGPVVDAIHAWLAAHDPDAAGVVPTILPGFTDSRWFRATFPDCAAYGFFPHRHMPLTQTYPLMHAADERIDLRDLAFAAEAYRDLVETLLG
ncbi:MAG: M20/M25/M40 family metallo-hydrolase [Solirubrobacteraceae bacterium]|nr:M20/M25/M40 family metallo-hydrolase [Solirubrobacteraceae bacterium]